MASIENIVKEKNKMIYEMDSDESKKYLMGLVRKYYLHYMNDNVDGMKSIKDKINKALVIYSNDDELKLYLNYCIALNSNIIIKSVLKRNGDLLKPFPTGESEFKTLHEKMQESVEYFKAIEDEMNASV